MKLIAGLGNPGKKYTHTRHNAGFLVLDALGEKYGASFIVEDRFRSESSAFELPNRTRVILAKPQTFMNNSGEALLLLINFFKMETTEILVIHDEMDLPLGEIRVSRNSRSAGHNGVESIIKTIGQDFTRIRVGINNPETHGQIPTEAYVLQKFTEDEESKLVSEITPKAIVEIQKFLEIAD